MKNKIMKLFGLLLLLLWVVPIKAQNYTVDMEQVKRKVQEQVAQLNDYISFMANPQKENETRQYYRKKALNLFIGKGYEYEEDGIVKDGVLMEVTSIRNKDPRPKPMRVYFTGLINMNYSAAEIETTKCYEIQVSKLKKIDDNEYVCTCDFEQVFKGFRDGRMKYGDKTRKRVKCYIYFETGLDENNEEKVECVVRLGDTTALETTRL